jgi:hypothetical protein
VELHFDRLGVVVRALSLALVLALALALALVLVLVLMHALLLVPVML